MRHLIIESMLVLASAGAYAQTANSVSIAPPSTSGAVSAVSGASLPVEHIGPNDLLGITVYDSPELSRSVRVGADGDIRLPMVKQHIHAAGLFPEQLENEIVGALKEEQVLVDPVVTVTITEYQSRPISIVGAVRTPVTFQATGNLTLLEAITKAGGLADNAGPEILVSHPQSGTDGITTRLTQRVSARGLVYEGDASLNLTLQGGDEVRVPEAGKVYVFGDVKKPGFFYLNGESEASVMMAVALSSGLDQHPANIAYIYRWDGGTAGRNEIPIPIKKIVGRKSPDVALMPNDILYVPDATGRAVGLKILEASIPIAAALGTTLLYIGLQ